MICLAIQYIAIMICLEYQNSEKGGVQHVHFQDEGRRAFALGRPSLPQEQEVPGLHEPEDEEDDHELQGGAGRRGDAPIELPRAALRREAGPLQGAL